jgi:serine/threonine-protein kinase
MKLSRIGRYEIKKELGRGGMATVYLGHDPRFERDVAIKLLPSQFMHDPKFLERFTREAKTIATLEHPSIVPVYDFGEEDEQPYLVMRFMPGGTLSQRLREKSLSFQEIIKIFTRLADGLDDAHAHGIVHRDLKPGNILFDQYDNAYLGDFGIAKLSEATASLTGSAVIGTPAYLSPEQAKGEGDIDGRSDVYSLGVILFQMLSGEQPYTADTPMRVVMKHILDPVPDILKVNPDLPPELNEIIEKAMAKDPDERIQTAGELADTLTTLSIRTPEKKKAKKAPKAPTTKKARRAPLPKIQDLTPTVDDLVTPEKPIAKKNQVKERVSKPKSGRMRGFIISGVAVIILAVLAFPLGGINTLQAALIPSATPTVSLTPKPTATPTPTATPHPLADKLALIPEDIPIPENIFNIVLIDFDSEDVGYIKFEARIPFQDMVDFYEETLAPLGWEIKDTYIPSNTFAFVSAAKDERLISVEIHYNTVGEYSDAYITLQ